MGINLIHDFYVRYLRMLVYSYNLVKFVRVSWGDLGRVFLFGLESEPVLDVFGG